MGPAASRLIPRCFQAPDLAVDVGTATTRLSARGWPRLVERPSAASPYELEPRSWFRRGPRRPPAPKQAAVPALRAGVVVDCEAAAGVLDALFRTVRRFGLLRPRVLACAPTDASPDERSALLRAVEIAGGRPIDVVPEPFAAAIGAGLDVASDFAQMIVDIGEGVTDIAVIRSGRILQTSAVRVACSDLHGAVRRLVQVRHGISLSPDEAARLTRIVGATAPRALPDLVRLHSFDEDQGRETDLVVRRDDLWEVLDPIYATIVAQVAATVHELPASIGCEVIESGICLTGGGSLLRGMPARIFAETRIAARVAERPMHAVIDGAGKILSTGIAAHAWD